MNSQISENMTPIGSTRLNRDLIKISEHQLGTKFRSKHDLYVYMTEILNKYLPPKESINKDFVKQILRNEKLVFDLNEVKQIKVPKYEELSVNNIYSQVYQDEMVQKYLPNKGSKSKPLDRKFFFDILNTIYPDYLKQLIEHAQNLRNRPEDNENKKQYILISDNWYDQLMSHPFISKKPGRTIQLLKESTKIYKARRSRERKDLGVTLKRFKGMNTEEDNRSNMGKESDFFLQEESLFSNNESQIDRPQTKRRFNI